MDLSPGTCSTPVTARAGDTAIRSATCIMFNYSNLTGFEALWYLKAQHDVLSGANPTGDEEIGRRGYFS